jgi:hypothetical protein
MINLETVTANFATERGRHVAFLDAKADDVRRSERALYAVLAQDAHNVRRS